ncbi:hypothetical protein AB8Q18_15020 [Neisseriaceae bacterium CLB008]
MRTKILLISWHFPPYKSSSAFNLFKRLKDTGYEYDVLQIKRADKPDNEKMFLYSESRFNRYEIEVPSENARNPEARECYIDTVLQFYEVLKQDNHYSAMISHSHEIVSHMAAMEIKKKAPSLRWIASFGDPIAANPFNESYKFPMLQEDSCTEAAVLSMSDRVVVTNIYQKELVLATQKQSLNEEKFYILPHCFDDRMYPNPSAQQQLRLYKDNIFRFKHVGMLYKYKRTSEPFMLGAQLLLKKHPELRGLFKLEFYGANDRFIQSAIEYGLEDTVSFNGSVSYLESLKVMSEADCLLLRDADFSDQGLLNTPFYPGKLADYMGAKKPILAVSMARGCVPDMLDKLGGVSCLEGDIEGIAAGMYTAIHQKLRINLQEYGYYSYKNIVKLARKAFSFKEDKQVILVAGHDLKFAKYLMEQIDQNDKYQLIVDKWQGHDKHNESNSLALLAQADTIFCEWGLGNLVWYSKHKKRGQKLIVRIHAQELRTRHLDKCKHENIDNYIFVSPYYFELMIAEFSLSRKKCKMMFNMVDLDLLDKPKLKGSEFHLGMIGDVPQSKRLDKALDIFEILYNKNNSYKLFVKGKRPEDYTWMHSKSKEPEMSYYQKQYQRIKNNGWQNNVFFEGFGPIEEWLQKIGWILSVSDQESFHLSVAEGLASGSCPVILHWPGAETIYPDQFIVNSIEEASSVIYSGKMFINPKFEASKFNLHTITSDILNLFNREL